MKIKNKFLYFFTSPRLYPFYFASLILLIIYYPVFFQDKLAVNDSDALELHIPNNYFVAQSYKHGRIPVWNPYFNLGQPVSDGTTPLFHPGLIFYLFLDPFLANTVEILTGLFLACIGIWYLLSSLGFSSFSVLVGSLIYILIGPVFFQHSYHLGFMAVVILPWCLYLFHRYDDTKQFRWLLGGIILSLLAVHSLDPDLLIYIFLGLFIDRVVTAPNENRYRFRYLCIWIGVFLLSLFTGLVNFLPFHQWLQYSSRTLHSYSGILTPGIINLLFACFTNTWFTPYPYTDVFYLYIGFVPLWLTLSGLLNFNKKNYIYRYFSLSLIFLLYYGVVSLLRMSGNFTILNTIEPWRSMVVFCLGLALISAEGVENIIERKASSSRISQVFIFLTLLFATLCFLKKLEMRIYANLVLTAFAIMLVTLIKNKGFKKVILLFAVLLNMGMPAFYYGIVRGACTGEVSRERILRTLPLFRYLRNTIKDPHCRVAILGGCDNSTLLAGLRTVPNYSPFYNKTLEQALLSDGLILPNNSQPYWMLLNYADAEKLSYYGVKYLIIDPITVKPEWQKEEFLISPQGWEEIKLPPEWSDYKVLENKYYLGRAYVLSSNGDRREVKFLVDKPQRVELEVSTNREDILILADLDYPGWKVYVDGNQSGEKFNYKCFRTVKLDPGVHEVEWVYKNNIQKIGLLFSGVSLFALLLLLLVYSRQTVKMLI